MDKAVKRQEWEALISEYRTSGLSQKKFAEQRQLALSTLHYWLYSGSQRRKEKANATKNRAAQMLPVAVKADRTKQRIEEGRRSEIIEVQLDNRFRLRFTMGTSPEYLGQLFSALMRQC